MSVNFSEIASQIIQTLRTTDPELDTSVGTTTRKIIDAVSEQIAEAYVDQHLLFYQYDIDSKTGADLDDFTQLFGIARLAAKRSSGVVTFARTANLSETVAIPINTQVTSSTDPPVVVQTAVGAFLEAGETSVTVPVQAVEPGPSGNLPAGTLTVLNVALNGITSVTNQSPLSGGTEMETDAQLRDRWKKTVFRSLAGTEQMYLGVALDDPDCYVANVIGASKRRREQLQMPISGIAEATVEDATHVYSEPVFVGENIDGGDILAPATDYTWNTLVNPPQVERLDATKMPNGLLFELDFEYQPRASRNDVGNGIVNRVDIYVGGQRPVVATQVVIFRTALRFTNGSGDALYSQKFVRNSGEHPTVNNAFVPLAYGPIITVPNQMSIGGQVYGLASEEHPLGTEATIGDVSVKFAYRIVHEDSPFGFTATSKCGLEWHASQLPANDSIFTIGGQEDGDYTFNQMVHDIQLNVDRWRLLGVDAKVHAAKQVQLRLNLAITYNRGVNIEQVDTAIVEAVGNQFTTTGFSGKVQVSDLLQTIHNITGVDNVRFLNGTDFPLWDPGEGTTWNVGIQRIADGEVVEAYVDETGRPRDIFLGDDSIPVLHSIQRVITADNTFGVA